MSLATGPLALGILVAGRGVGSAGAAVADGRGDDDRRRADPGRGHRAGWHALLALRFLAGLALAGVPAVAMAYVAEEVDARSIGAAMGLYIAGSGMGGMGGRLVASMVAALADWRWALAAVGVSGLIMAEAFRRLAPPSRRFVASEADWLALPRGAAALFRDPGLRLLYAEGFLLMGIFVTIYNYAGFHLLGPPYGLSQAMVGAVFLLYILGSISSSLFGKLAGKVGRRRIFWMPVALTMTGVALTAARPLWPVVLGIAVVTIGFFGAHSIASAWVGRRGGVARGQAAAWYLFFYYMGSSVLGSAGGIAWTRAGWPGVVAFCLMLGALALAAASCCSGSPARRNRAGPPHRAGHTRLNGKGHDRPRAGLACPGGSDGLAFLGSKGGEDDGTVAWTRGAGARPSGAGGLGANPPIPY